MAGMTTEERFQFDLQGYLVVRGVLTPGEVAELNELADEAWAGEHDESGLRRASHVSRWGPRFRGLIDHPGIVPYLVELMGPKFRIDHDYCMFMRRGTSRSRLHGGPSPQCYEGDHWYRFYPDGTIRNGLTVFTWNLADCNPGDGGFACVPGSHKTNLRAAMPEEVLGFERPAHYVSRRSGRGTSSSSPRRWCTAPFPGTPTTSAGPCSTSTAPGTPPGAAPTTTPPITRGPPSSRSASWPPLRSASGPTRCRLSALARRSLHEAGLPRAPVFAIHPGSQLRLGRIIQPRCPIPLNGGGCLPGA